MLTEIFCQIDDFCKLFFKKEQKISSKSNNKKAGRKPKMHTSEILTILVYYHYSGFKNFKSYYNLLILGEFKSAFSVPVSYNRFIELRQESCKMLALFAQSNAFGICDKYSIIDSCKLEVCHIRREYSHKVFKGLATKGKTSTGWFFGFKMHVIINSSGEIINFFITPGNIPDNNVKVIDFLTQNVFGKITGDKGYMGLFNHLWAKGIKLITKIRKNMKNKLLDFEDKLLLKKRSTIESVFGILKNKFSLQSTSFRSVSAFFSNIFSTLIAYKFQPQKPSFFNENRFKLFSI